MRLASILSVVVISGRSADDLGEWFGDLPINLVAEHGASFKRANGKNWRTYEKTDPIWKELLRPVLEKYAALTPGARVEEKEFSLVWHYRSAPPYYAQKYLVIIKRALAPFLKSHGLQILKGNKVIEIKNPDITKGRAAKFWLNRDYDFVLGIGDDATDEELFLALPETAYSIKVGRGRTVAKYRLTSYRDTIKVLKRLTRP